MGGFNNDDPAYHGIYNSVMKILQKEDMIDYRKLMQRVSPTKRGGSPQTLKNVIKNMAKEGIIEASYEDKVLSRPKCTGREVYSLVEEE